MREIVGEFEVTVLEDRLYDEPTEGPALGQSAFSKKFRGQLEGSSTVQMLGVQTDGGQGYVAMERFSGSIDGRHGTVVMQHGAIADGTGSSSFGYIVPGTGTEELAGLKGTVQLKHDDNGVHMVLVLNEL